MSFIKMYPSRCVKQKSLLTTENTDITPVIQEILKTDTAQPEEAEEAFMASTCQCEFFLQSQSQSCAQ